jgi:hypothetical protein
MNRIKDRYCFIHLPKTAGMSILQFLRTTLGEVNVLNIHSTGAYRHVPLEYLSARYRALAGHFEVSRISRWMFENVFMFTFLRDPVDRLLSNYYYHRNVQQERVTDEMTRAQQLDLLSLLRECNLSRLSIWSNWQTFALSGLEESEFAPGNILEPAKRTLEKLDFVGFYESLREDVRQLSEICGWDSSLPLPTVNVTPRRSSQTELDAETLDLIRRLNQDDIKLYEYAKALPAKSPPALDPSTPGVFASSFPPTALLRAERGTREIFITALSTRGIASNCDLIEHDDQVEIRLQGKSTINCPNLIAGIRITDSLGFEVYGTNSLLIGAPMALKAGQQFMMLFSFPAVLAAGKYHLTAALQDADGRTFHWIDNCCLFRVQSHADQTFEGMVDLKAQVHVSLQMKGGSA